MGKKRFLYNLSLAAAVVALIAMLTALLPAVGAIVIGAGVIAALVLLVCFWLLTVFTLTSILMPIIQRVAEAFNLIASFAKFSVQYITPYAALAAIVLGVAALVLALMCRKLSKGDGPEPVPELEPLPRPEPPTKKALKAWKKATKKAHKKRKAAIRRNNNYVKCTAQLVIGGLCLAVGLVGALLLLPPVRDAILNIFS